MQGRGIKNNLENSDEKNSLTTFSSKFTFNEKEMKIKVHCQTVISWLQMSVSTKSRDKCLFILKGTEFQRPFKKSPLRKLRYLTSLDRKKLKNKTKTKPTKPNKPIKFCSPWSHLIKCHSPGYNGIQTQIH